MAEYMAIKDFADRAGVTPSAVYQRLDRDLKPFLKVLEGKKMLDSQALKLYEEQDLQLNRTLEELRQIEQYSRLYDPSAYIDDLKSQISALTDQNSKLQDELFKEREHSRAQSDTISELALRFSNIGHANQYLLAVEQQRATEQQGRKRQRFFQWFKRESVG